MNNLKVLGVTGPTGAGKSTVCKLLKNYGMYIIDADEVAHDVLQNDIDCINLLIKNFSSEILSLNNAIDRSKLAKKAFSSVDNTRLLNRITHPFIVKKIKSTLKSHAEKIVVIDAPLLFESHLDKICDDTWCVIAPLKTRVARIIARDNISYNQASARISAQNSDKFYLTKSNVIIDGSLSLEELQIYVSKILVHYNELTN